MKGHNIEKEKYAMSLLGYEIVQVNNDNWKINDKEGNEVGYIKYERIPNSDNRFHTKIYKKENGKLLVHYDDYRNENDKYYHYEFDDGQYTIVLMDLKGPKKSIDIRETCDNSRSYRLTWNTEGEEQGFDFNYGVFIRKANGWNEMQNTYIARYLVKAQELTCVYETGSGKKIGNMPETDTKYFYGDMPTILSSDEEESALPVILLRKLNNIMKSLPFEKSLEEIIGQSDIHKCGLSFVFEVLRILDRMKIVSKLASLTEQEKKADSVRPKSM